MKIINIYAPNRGAARCTSQLLNRIKTHIDKNTLIVGDLNTPLSAIDRSPKQKNNKETRALNDIMDQWTSQIYTGHYTPEPKNTHSILMPMEHSQKETMF